MPWLAIVAAVAQKKQQELNEPTNTYSGLGDIASGVKNARSNPIPEFKTSIPPIGMTNQPQGQPDPNEVGKQSVAAPSAQAFLGSIQTPNINPVLEQNNLGQNNMSLTAGKYPTQQVVNPALYPKNLFRLKP
jgi:hypothetical protein